MNTPDEVKEKMLKDCVGVENYYPKEGKHIIHINKIDLFNLMEEYAKAYAPVPDELTIEAMDFYWRWLGTQLDKKDLVDIQRKNYLKLWSELQYRITNSLVAAPVPGKEEIETVRKKWRENYPNKSFEHSAIRGVIDYVINDIIELLAASPSTASNEDKFVWTDELVKNYAEGYRFSSSRLSIELFKKDKWLSQESVEINYKLAMEEVEPKAVQQAAKSIEKIAEEKYPYANGTDSAALAWNNRTDVARRAFLAGASFNSNKNDDDIEVGFY